MRATAAIALTAILVTQAAGTHAEEERYRLEKTEKGYVRMDTQTGAMSICEEFGGQLVCKLAADEREAYQDQIEHLENSLKALENRVAALENKEAAAPALPTEEEFEKGMGYMERFLRRLMGVVKDIEREDNPSEEPEENPQPTPNKT